MSPFKLLNGREPFLPLDILLKRREKYLGTDYYELLLKEQHRAFFMVLSRLKKIQKRRKDRKIRTGQAGTDLKLRDNVYLRKKTIEKPLCSMIIG